MICVALAGSSLSYCTGSSVMFGCAALICASKPLMRASVVDTPGFTLTNQFGQPVSLSAYRKVVILAFNDAECTTICPLTTVSLLNAKDMLGAAAPGRNTAARWQFWNATTTP